MTEERLNEEQITNGLSATNWQRDGETIVRDVELEDFAAVIALVNRVAAVAEETNHHPDILVHGWNKLRLTLSTHSAGGLTAADFSMASTLDGLL